MLVNIPVKIENKLCFFASRPKESTGGNRRREYSPLAGCRLEAVLQILSCVVGERLSGKSVLARTKPKSYVQSPQDSCHEFPRNTVKRLDSQKALLEPGLALLHGPSSRIQVKDYGPSWSCEPNLRESPAGSHRGPSTRTSESGLRRMQGRTDIGSKETKK